VYCYKCGKEIDDDSEICPNCGEKLKSDNKESSINQQRKNKKTIILLSILISAVICIVSIFGVLSNKEKLNQNSNENQEEQNSNENQEEQNSNENQEEQNFNDNKVEYEYHNIGDSFNYDGLDIELKLIDLKDYAISGSVAAGDGYKWIRIETTFTNNTPTTKKLTDWGNSIYISYIKYYNEEGVDVNYNRYWFSDSRIFQNPESLTAYGTYSGYCIYKIPIKVLDMLIQNKGHENLDENNPSDALFYEFTFNKKSDAKKIIRINLQVYSYATNSYYFSH